MVERERKGSLLLTFFCFYFAKTLFLFFCLFPFFVILMILFDLLIRVRTAREVVGVTDTEVRMALILYVLLIV